MSFFNRTRSLLRRLIHRKDFEADLRAELSVYVEELADEKVRRGMGPVESRRDALIEMGGVEQVKEACRDERGFVWLDSFAADIRYGFRNMSRARGFCFTVIATIGLGLGLNTAVFTLFEAYVLRPLPVHEPRSLYEVTWKNRTGQPHILTLPEAAALRLKKDIFTDILTTRNFQTSISGNQMFGQLVSGNYFTMLGIGADKGRPLLPEDTAADGNSAVIVLGYGTWRNEFSSDPGIIGKKLYLRGHPVEVIGVARQGFTGLGSLSTEFWAPLTLAPVIAGGNQEASPLAVTGRLNSALTFTQVSAAITTWAGQATADRPEPERSAGAVLISRATKIPPDPAVLLAVAPIFVAFALIIAVACANVSNMMLARALARRREIGIRFSLGAARSRLIRQSLTESLVLGIPAIVAGLAVSTATLSLAQRVVVATIPSEYAFLMVLPDLSTGPRGVCFIVLAALLSTMFFGLIPALQVSRMNLTPASRGDFGGRILRSRLRDALVTGQVTICVLLLICAAVVLRGRQNMSRQSLGLQTHGVFFLRVSHEFRPALEERIRQEMPRAPAATVWRVPLHGRSRLISVTSAAGGLSISAGYNFVSPEYFDVLGIPLVAGRNFSADEARSEGPEVILSEATARRLWPNGSPLGQSLRIDRDNSPAREEKHPAFRMATVIGVSADAVTGLVGDGLETSSLYFPAGAHGTGNGSLLVRASGSASLTSRRLREIADRVANGSVDQIASLDQVLATQLYPFRVMFWISSILGALALLLASSGVYGVVAYLVNQRTREFGIRMALGATTGAIVRSVLSHSLQIAVRGSAVGVLLALAVAPVFAHEIEAVNPYDGIAYAAGFLAAVATALAASFFPSWRTSQIAPASSLRCE